jgi:transaldolase
MTTNDAGITSHVGPVSEVRERGRGPGIWLAGDPEDLKPWMPFATGIVTNTVVQNDLVKKYGPLTELIKRYLDITDLPVVVEIDGHTTEELLEVGRVFTEMSKQIILKIPCSVHSLAAFRALEAEGVETYCTTVFSLPQAAAVAQAGVTHILPFCEPVKAAGGDPTKLVRECAQMFSGWKNRPYITAALIRSVDTAHAALRDGADGIIIFWTVLQDMMQHALTDQWNQIFMDEWVKMHQDGKLDDLPVKLSH